MTSLVSSLGIVSPSPVLGGGLVLGIAPADEEAFSFTDDLDPFCADPVTDAGRMQPTGMAPTDGVYAFCLGHDTPGFFGFFQPGDYDEISQSGPFPANTNAITFRTRTRAPTTPPPEGFSWVASVSVDGVEVGSRVLALSSPIDWDWLVDIESTAGGTHTLAFRLTLNGPALTPPSLPVIELEVPAFYVDNVAFVSLVAPVIANETPVDGQGDGRGPAAPGSTTIDFDVFGLGTALDLFESNGPASLRVSINRTPAIVAGVVQSGFSGSVDVDGELETAHVSVAPTGGFASAQFVFIEATAALAGGAQQTRTWGFEVADTTPPLIAMVQAITPKQLRVTWTKTIEAENPAGAHDGLNPTLYSLAAVQPDPTVPAVRGTGDPANLPSVISVEVVSTDSPFVIDLFTSADVSPGIDYVVTAAGVADPLGNATTTIATMPGFVLPWPQGRVFDLWRRLPQMNRVEDTTKDLIKFVGCLQEPANLLLYDVDNWTDILDVDRAPEPMLDAMLADLGNPFPFVLTVIQKRQLVRLLVPIYQQKGTAPGIVNAIRFFTGITVTISSFTGGTMELGISVLGGDAVPPYSDPTMLGSWVLGPGNRYALYSFSILSPVTLTADQVAMMRFIANYMKPGHTHLIDIVGPTPPDVYDPAELGISELGVDWLLHL